MFSLFCVPLFYEMLINEREHREITVDILNKDYPDIALQIRDKITAILPARQLYDLDRMAFIISEFKKFFNVDYKVWINQSGSDRMTESREVLAATVALIYSPARVLAMDYRVRPGVMRELCRLTGCSKAVMSRSLSNSVVAYRAYREFKDKVTGFYQHLVNNGLFMKTNGIVGRNCV